MKFNEKLKALREAKSYTQDEIASKLNISRQSISKWEQGINEPDFDTVKELCKILDCSIAELIDDDHEVVSTKEEKDERVAGWLFKITLALLVTASLFLVGLIFACNDEIITHWDIDGNVTVGSRFTLLFGLILLAFFGSLAVLMRIWGKKTKRFERYKVGLQTGTLVFVVLSIAGCFTLVGFMIAGHTKSTTALLNLITIGALSLITSFGPLSFPKWNKRNPLFGFRTNFTISCEEGWNKVNTFSSIVLTVTSLITYILAIIFIEKTWAVFLIVGIVVGLIPCIIFHEIIKRKLTK